MMTLMLTIRLTWKIILILTLMSTSTLTLMLSIIHDIDLQVYLEIVIDDVFNVVCDLLLHVVLHTVRIVLIVVLNPLKPDVWERLVLPGGGAQRHLLEINEGVSGEQDSLNTIFNTHKKLGCFKKLELYILTLSNPTSGRGWFSRGEALSATPWKSMKECPENKTL